MSGIPVVGIQFVRTALNQLACRFETGLRKNNFLYGGLPHDCLRGWSALGWSLCGSGIAEPRVTLPETNSENNP